MDNVYLTSLLRIVDVALPLLARNRELLSAEDRATLDRHLTEAVALRAEAAQIGRPGNNDAVQDGS